MPEDIDPHLCTHIIFRFGSSVSQLLSLIHHILLFFSFGWMKANKLTSFDSTDETKNGKKGTYERVVELKKKNPDLKVLLAVGMSICLSLCS